MDIHMNGMDGFEATRRIMALRPVPIVVISAGWEPLEVEKTFQAMAAGAVAILPKPDSLSGERAAELVKTVREAAATQIRPRIARSQSGGAHFSAPGVSVSERMLRIVVGGASTGGPVAVRTFLSELPREFPLPILLVQHMSPGFTQGFVEWLKGSSSLPVELAAQGVRISSGRVYVAPEGRHTEVLSGGVVHLTDAPPEHGVRPSASRLFRSALECFGSAVAGVLFSGMGYDGAEELQRLRKSGGLTFAQDEESSVAWGMPGAAVRDGGAEYVLPPHRIAQVLAEIVLKKESPWFKT
jgi:two-component system chemotaxis response regulator CheB